MGQVMKDSGTIARRVLTIILPFILIIGSLLGIINQPSLYNYGAQKYGVLESLQENGLALSKDELARVYDELVRYFNSRDEFINITVNSNGQLVALFTQEEALHFKDVKGLIHLGYRVVTIRSGLCDSFCPLGQFWAKSVGDVIYFPAVCSGGAG